MSSVIATAAVSAAESAGSGAGVNVMAQGAKGDVKTVTDGKMANGSAILESLTAAFTANDVGKIVNVQGAGVAKVVLITTIAGFTNATTVTLATTAKEAVENASTTYGTDDTAAFAAAIALLTPNGRLLGSGKNFGLVPVEGGEVGALSLPEGCTMEQMTLTAFATTLAEGKTIIIKKGTVTFKSVQFFRVLTEKVVVAVQGGLNAAKINFLDCKTQNFTYGAKGWAKSTTTILLSNTEMEGEKSVTKEGSMGVNHAGGLGAIFIMTNGSYIHDTGEPGGAEATHDHCVYLFETVAFFIGGGSRFDHAKGGRYCQSFGVSEAGELIAANAPAFCIYDGVAFGSDIDLTNVSGAIATNCLQVTQIANCAFAMSRKAIAVQGDVEGTNVSFPSGNDVTTRMVKTEEVSGGGGLFPASGFETTWTNVKCGGKSRGFIEPNGHCRITASLFTDTSAEGKHIKALPGSYVEVSDCTFKGAKPAFGGEGNATIKSQNNRYTGTAGAIDGEATTVLIANFNDFSQTGATLTGAFASISATGNFGSKGLETSGLVTLVAGKASVASTAITVNSVITVTQRSGAIIKTGLIAKPEAGKVSIESGEASTAEIAWALVR